MVLHWRRERGPRWRLKLTVNALGSVTTGVVTVIVAATKFLEGAWIVLLIIPLLAAGFARIHGHYAEEARELDVGHPPPPPPPSTHNVVIPVARLDRAVSEAVGYALSLGGVLHALHVEVDDDVAGELRKAWAAWGVDVPLLIVPSPYRTVLNPLLHYIRRVQREEGGRVTVVLPEVVPRRWWQEGLHNQTAISLQLALRTTPNVIVTAVPVRLER